MVLPVTVTGWRDRAVTNCDPSQKNDDPMLREISMPIMPAESVAVPEIDEAFALVTFTCAAAVPEKVARQAKTASNLNPLFRAETINLII